MFVAESQKHATAKLCLGSGRANPLNLKPFLKGASVAPTHTNSQHPSGSGYGTDRARSLATGEVRCSNKLDLMVKSALRANTSLMHTEV